MLDIKARNQLRAIAHELKPVVSVGKKGITQSLITEIAAALLAHELIKVQFQKSALDELESVLQEIGSRLGAEIVEMRGHVATLYKMHPEKPRIKVK